MSKLLTDRRKNERKLMTKQNKSPMHLYVSVALFSPIIFSYHLEKRKRKIQSSHINYSYEFF